MHEPGHFVTDPGDDRQPAATDRTETRRATDADAAAIADVWLASVSATYAWPSVHTDDDVRAWIREVVVPNMETWVAVDADRQLTGFMALNGDELDQLCLRPGETGRGLGSRFVQLAKARRPDGLNLYTFQVNLGARRFYERHGFVIVDLNDGARNEERQPDVHYSWLPAPARD